MNVDDDDDGKANSKMNEIKFHKNYYKISNRIRSSSRV